MNKPLKISFVANTSWSIYNFRLEVAQHLHSLGHIIFIITPRDKHSEKLIAQGFKFIEAPLHSYSNNPIDDLRYFAFLCRIYRHYQFDHIFHYTIKSNIYGSFAAKACELKSTMVITGLGRLVNMAQVWKRTVVHKMYKYAIAASDHIWFLNKEDERYFRVEGVCKNPSVRVLPSEGVNLKKYALSKPKDRQEISFLFAGRLIKEKGIMLFLNAAEEVWKYYPSVSFDVVGFIDQKDDDSIDQDLLLDYHKRGIVTYHGDTEDIKPFIADASCVVLPSSYGEGVSRILLEAGAMSTPIITTHNRGCSDVVIDGYNGFLCRPNDASHLIDQILAFISLDSEARDMMGKNGRKFVAENFDVNFIIEFYTGHLGISRTNQKEHFQNQ